MSSSNNSSSGGIGILGMLGVLFVGLKLLGFIDWSWWWVTVPFWGGLAFVVIIGLIWGLIWGILRYIKYRKLKRKSDTSSTI